MKVSVILVSPNGSGNVGGIARAMGNFGVTDLRLVTPRCDLQADDCKRMAMRSYSIVENAKLFRNLREAQADLHCSIALSGKPVNDARQNSDLFSFGQKLPNLFSNEDHIGLVFGREETGLRLTELAMCDWQISIPTSETHPSINLCSAVAITLSVIFEWGGLKSEPKKISPSVLRKITGRPAKEVEEKFFERLLDVLAASKFLNPQNPEHIIEDLRAIFHRAQLSTREMRIIFGVLSNVQIALGLQDARQNQESHKISL